MHKISLVLVALIFIKISFSQPAVFDEKELAIINTKSLEVIKNYESLINNIGETTPIDINEAKSNGESLIELFVNRKVLVFNDLDPSYLLSEFYEVETYISNLILWYPDGIDVKLNYESAKSTTVRQHDEDIFSLDIKISKKIDGNYLNKKINENFEELIFRMAFTKEGNTTKNFQIAGIRNAKSETRIDDLKTLQEVSSENLSEEELAKVKNGLVGILNDYTNFLALIGDPQELDEDKVFYKNTFKDLFKDDNVKLFNDLENTPESKLLSVEDYLALYENRFENGVKNLSLNIDSAEYGAVSINDQGEFYTYVYLDKFFSGLNNQKKLFKSHTNLMFQVNFKKAGNSYTGFNIESIDKKGYSYFESDNNEIEVPTLALRPVKRDGFSLIGSISYGLTNINDENLITSSLESDNYAWKMENGYGFNVFGGLIYYFNNKLGIYSGIGYQNYLSNYRLEGSFQDDQLSYDVNGNHHYLIVNANYDSTMQLHTINIPIVLKYNFGKPGSWGLSLSAGVNFIYSFSSEYIVEGNYKTSGYYPDNQEVLQYMDYVELGFVDRSELDLRGEMNLANFINSGYFNVNLVVPLGYYSTVELGPEILYGFTDLAKRNSEYNDIFERKIPSKEVNINYLGFTAKITYKL